MKLVDMTLVDYTDMLASSRPAPGGGSTAALLGAQGAALVAMVCELTIGRKKYAEHEALCITAREQAQGLKARFLDLIDRDTQAYNQVSAALLMPREDAVQLAARQAAMQQALRACTLPPLDMMDAARGALQVAASLIGTSNANAASDLGVAALCLRAALQGAWLNVVINLKGIEEEAYVLDMRAKGGEMLEEALPLADQVYKRVSENLQ